MADRIRWTRDELRLAFHLYCQLPFGKLHSRNPDIVELAALLERTPGSVAMKLVNFASLDPAITGTGRRGLGNASGADREIWNEFHSDWDRLTVEADLALNRLRGAKAKDKALEVEPNDAADYYGQTAVSSVEVRLKQGFFRRSVLASYQGKCCITEITAEALLVASHIVPWKADPHNQLNPRNGLCLSALHDRAFDRGWITLDADLKVQVSPRLANYADEDFVRASIMDYAGKKISLPEKFQPNPAFLERHRKEVFIRA